MSTDSGRHTPGTPAGRLGPTTTRELVIAALAGLIVGYLVVGTAPLIGGAAPLTPWALGGMLSTLAVAGWFYARSLVQRIRDARASVTPEEGVRALVMGKVMAFGGAFLVGFQVLYVLAFVGRWSVPAPRERVVHAAVTAVAAVLFLLAGRRLEDACISPHAGDDDPDDREPPTSLHGDLHRQSLRGSVPAPGPRPRD